MSIIQGRSNSQAFPLRLLVAVAVFTVVIAACGDDNVDVVGGPDSSTSDGSASDGGSGSDGGASGGTRPSLAGDWVLTSATIDGAVVELPAEAVIDVTIERGLISGNGGCNGFGGSIAAADDGSLRLAAVSITEMACLPLSILDFETGYVQALVAATEWEVTPTGLIFRGEGTELRYEPGAPPVHLALEGTIWTFDTIFDGVGVDRAASTPRQDKPPVTMVLANGEVTLRSDDCGDVIFAFNYESGGTEGNVSVPDRDAAVAECSDRESNMAAAVKGIVSSSGFMINESRLTFIGLAGETVGFVAENLE